MEKMSTESSKKTTVLCEAAISSHADENEIDVGCGCNYRSFVDRCLIGGEYLDFFCSIFKEIFLVNMEI